jgi:hypothetical protein
MLRIGKKSCILANLVLGLGLGSGSALVEHAV